MAAGKQQLAPLVTALSRTTGPDATYGELLGRFVSSRDEAAFEALVRRHGPMVLAVCRRTVLLPADVEDAFQATFLVLLQKAPALASRPTVGDWLHGVARRVALKARAAAARRREREGAAARPEGTPDVERNDWLSWLDQEVGRLPEKYRQPLVLCDLEGLTRAEAARALGWPEGTVAGYLARGRALLARRLLRRAAAVGGAVTAGALAVGEARALPDHLLVAARPVALGRAPAAVLALASEAARGPLATALALGVVALVAGGLLAAGAMLSATPEGPGVKPVSTPVPVADPEKPDFVSDVRFSPDGRRYAVVAGGRVRVRETASGKEAFAITGEAAGYSADGKTLFVMAEKVRECDAVTGKARKEHPRPKTKWGWHLVRFSPDGKQYVAHFGMFAGLYDTATGFEPVRLDEAHEMAGGVLGVTGEGIAWSPDGKRVAAVGVLVPTGLGGLGRGAAVWNAATGKQVFALTPDITDGPRAVAFSPDGTLLAVGFGKSLRVYDAKTFKELRNLGEHGVVTALAFSPDGKQLAAGARLPILNGADKPPAVIGHQTVVQLIDAKSGKELKRFDGFEGVNHMASTVLPVSALAFSPDGKKLVAGTGLVAGEEVPKKLPRRGEVKVWALAATDGEKGKEPVAWGKAAGGLQAGLAVQPADKRAYQVGEAARFVVKLRNVGDRAIEMRYLAVDPGARVGPSGLDAAGQRPAMSGPVYRGGGGRAVRKLALAAGEEVEFASPELRFGPPGEASVRPEHTVQAGPGKYRVSYHVYFLNADGSGNQVSAGEAEVEVTPPRKLGRIPDPVPELRAELARFDEQYRGGTPEQFAELEKRAAALAKRYPGKDDQARIWAQVAWVAGQSAIDKHRELVRKYAAKCLEAGRDPLDRGRMYGLLASAVDVGGFAFPKGRREAAEALLTGYRELLAQELPESVPELPAVEKLSDVTGRGGLEAAQALARHAAQVAAREEAEFVRDQVERRETLVRQLRDLYKPDPKRHGRTPEGLEELRDLAAKKLSDRQARDLVAKVIKE
jgi:RNA polymerase sigma factor (sigma-70 family)